MTTLDPLVAGPPAPPQPWPEPARTRLAGLDAARGLAVIGMIVALVAAADAAAPLRQAVNGGAAVLFGVLGGLSLALMSRAALRSGDPVARLLLTAAYPVLTWMPFLLAGMAIGRLAPARSAGRLIAGGLVGAVLGYGGSWLAVDVLGGRQALLDPVAPAAAKLAMPEDQVPALLSDSSYGTVSTTSPAWLLAPVAATGALALTLYAGHTAALALVQDTAALDPWPLTAVFVAGAVLTATGWRILVGRGPLEGLSHAASARAAAAR